MGNQRYNLTKKLIEEWGIPEKRSYYRDSQVRGLYLDISPAGSKRRRRRMKGGRSDRLFIGPIP